MVKSVFDAQSYTRDDFFIEAYLAESENLAVVRVDVSRIAYRKTISDKISALVLADGKEILVALPLNQLDEKIYSPSFREGPMIDLKPFTGDAANISPDGSLKIKLYVSFKDTAKNEFALATIDNSHVAAYKEDNNKPYIRIKDEFKTSSAVKSMILPCVNGLYTTIPVDTLNSLVEDAEIRRLAVLDLSAQTKPVAPDKIRPPISL